MVKSLPLNALLGRAQQIIDSSLDRDAKLQRICELLHHEVDDYDWVGFYLTDRDTRELVLGPFVGEPTEHMRIPFGRGICGQAAERKETFTVQDVSQEANYLSCSTHVRSEIVVPVLKDGHVLGELDIDSHSLAPFGPLDVELLEGMCAMLARLF
jgi:L-methionine (R)-S-oxide reductase